MKQNIAGYEIDVATREEAQKDLYESMGHHFSLQIREMYRGIKALKLPVVAAQATGAALTLPLTGGAEPVQCGPESGYFWRVQRVTVTSSGVDAGAVSLYAGSDPANTSGQFLVDNTLKVGQAYYPGNRGLYLWPGEQLYVAIVSVAANTYRLTGLAVEVPSEMQGKLLSGG